ncbi:phage tail tape measure protein [Thermosipho globiformans]|uniref:phage tail tape measure protein n=1 Tax=Thermosipho globiformans TaxID=380685 RepID=UPI0035714AF0
MPANETLSVTIKASDSASPVLKSVSQNLDSFQKKIEYARQKLQQFSTAINTAIKYTAAFTGALAGAVSASTYFAAKVEKSFQNARTMMKMTQEQAQSMQKALSQLSIQSGKSLDELNNALYMLGSAGVRADNALNVLKATTISSIAGATDLTTAFQGAIAIINAYGMSIDDLTTVYAMQFEAVKQGLVTYEELARDFGQLIPSARNLGVSLQEALTGYTALTTAGFGSSEAANAAEGAFQDLMQQAENFKKLGVDIYDANGQFVGLTKVVEQLRKAMQGLTDDEKRALLQQLNLSETGTRALLTWVNNYEKYQEVLQGIKGDTTALMEAYKLQTQSVSYLLDRLKASIGALNIAFFNAIRTGVVDFLSKLIAGIRQLTKWIDVNKETVGKVVWALLRLGATLIGILVSLKLFTQLAQIMMFVLKPMNLLILAVVSAIYLIWDALQKPGQGGILNFIKAIFDGFSWFVGFLKRVFLKTKLLAESYIKSGMNSFLAWLKAIAVEVGRIIKSLIDEIMGGLLGEERWDKIKEAVKAIIDGLTNKEGIPVFLNFILTAKEEETGETGGEGTKKKSLVRRLLDWAASGVKDISFTVSAVLKEIPNWLKDILEGVKDTWELKLKPVLESTFDTAKEIVLKFIQGPVTVAQWIINGVKEIILKFKEATHQSFDWLINGTQIITIKLEKAWDKAFDWLANGIQNVKIMLQLGIPKKEFSEEKDKKQVKHSELDFSYNGNINIQNPMFNLTGEAASTINTVDNKIRVEKRTGTNFFPNGIPAMLMPLPDLMSGMILGVLDKIFGFIGLGNSSTFSLGLGLGFFAEGGYTGSGGKYEPAGIVHKGEYVIPANIVSKYPELVAMLEKLRLKGYAEGGLVDLVMNYVFGGGVVNDIKTIANAVQTIADLVKESNPEMAEQLELIAKQMGAQSKITWKATDKETPYLKGFSIFTNLANFLRKMESKGQEKGINFGELIDNLGFKLNKTFTQIQANAENFVLGIKHGYEGFTQIVSNMDFKAVALGMVRSIPDVIGNTFGAIVNGLKGAFGGLLPFIEKLPMVQQLLNPLTTILSAAMDVLGPIIENMLKPFVTILKVLGNVLGTLLMPVLQIIQPLLIIIAQSIAWVYNTVLVPIARGIYFIFGLVREGFVRLYNWIAGSWIGKLLGLQKMAEKSMDQIWKEAQEKIPNIDLNTMETSNLTQEYTANVTRSGPETVYNIVNLYADESFILDSKSKFYDFLAEAVQELIDTGQIKFA